MRTILFTLFLFYSATALAQKPLDNLWNVSLGVTIDSAKKVLLAKLPAGAELVEEEDGLSVEHVQFAGRKASVGFLFFNNQLHSMIVYFDVEQEADILLTYEELRKEISDKYFAPRIDTAVYKDAAPKHAGITLEAIKNEDMFLYANWVFPSVAETAPERTRSITLMVGNFEEGVTISLRYQDDKVAQEEEEEYRRMNR